MRTIEKLKWIRLVLIRALVLSSVEAKMWSIFVKIENGWNMMQVKRKSGLLVVGASNSLVPDLLRNDNKNR